MSAVPSVPTLPDILERLGEPLEKDEVSRRKIPGGSTADYLRGGDVIRELTRVFGPLGWSHELVRLECTDWKVEEVEEVDRKTGEVRERWDAFASATVRLVLHPLGLGITVTHADVGHGSPQGAMPERVQAVEQAEKGAVTDALKRAARVLGNRFGLAFYFTAAEQRQEEMIVPPGARDLPGDATVLLDGKHVAGPAPTAEPPVELDGRVVYARWLMEGRVEPELIREAVRNGSTPDKPGDLLAGKLPPDPTRVELAGLGLEDEQLDELFGYPADQVLDVTLLRTVALACGRALGREEVTRLWSELGVQLAPGVKVTGYLARLMAAAAAVHATKAAPAGSAQE